MDKKQFWPTIFILIIVIGAIILIESFFPKDPDLEYADFAKCLTTQGWIMYGTAYCPHCIDQKAMFKDAFRYVNYVACDIDPEKCVEKDIYEVPTWTSFSGERLSGIQTLEELSRLSGCVLPR
ncbi:MAG TPA: hypothetical protein PLN18_01470 [Candidatus Colwellbacteria bacterium]|mgnify:FL=1|nr:hypothetical protein [Candidatus Colwellbacteria bacterium]HQA96016.1 hypothetical protein [Candidatus Colwellbacteria bacterium]